MNFISMKTLTSIVIAFFAILSISSSIAQTSPNGFYFPVDKHDFGLVIEGDQATHAFEFTNVGKDTILLTSANVKASCGCTTPSFTTTPILPGQKGSITAQFNSSGRPGVFTKNVTVYYKDQMIKMLMIKGVVEAKAPEVTFTPDQLKKSSKAVFEKTTVNYGKVERNKPAVYSFKLTNSGKDTLFIKNTQIACYCTQIKLKAEKSGTEVKYILPGKTAKFEITYTPASDGLNKDKLIVTTSDLVNNKVIISLDAEVVESLQQKSIMQE
jgi:hypothetical protein